MPNGREKVVTVVLKLDIILISVMRGGIGALLESVK
jgi:hypothetical protein